MLYMFCPFCSLCLLCCNELFRCSYYLAIACHCAFHRIVPGARTCFLSRRLSELLSQRGILYQPRQVGSIMYDLFFVIERVAIKQQTGAFMRNQVADTLGL